MRSRVSRRGRAQETGMGDAVERFLSQTNFAVVGASSDRAKYGNKVLRAYLQHSRRVLAVNPKDGTVEGVPAYASLSAIPAVPDAVSVITPPPVTEKVVEEAGRLGIRHIWLQPGAESPAAVARARELGMNVISGGPCVLVVLGYRD